MVNLKIDNQTEIAISGPEDWARFSIVRDGISHLMGHEDVRVATEKLVTGLRRASRSAAETWIATFSDPHNSVYAEAGDTTMSIRLLDRDSKPIVALSIDRADVEKLVQSLEKRPSES